MLVNVAIWVVINAQPGWQSFSFLTAEFAVVLPIVNLSLVASIVLNAAYLVFDPRWFRSLGQLIVSMIGCVVSWRMLSVFPFDLDPGWEVLVRTVLVLALFGSGIGALVNLVRLVKGAD
jgi:hypothetical protein